MILSVTPFLWFDDNAEDAVTRYQEVFDDTEVHSMNRHPDGSLFIAEISVHGQRLTLMNAGPVHRLTDAFSLAVSVETQEEIDRLTQGLIADGGRLTMCGWLVDAFGVSWQIVPTALGRLLSDPDRDKAERVREAMMGMVILDIGGLQAAYDG